MEEDLKIIARQLKMPEGDKGIEMAQMMHATNIQMTLHAIQKLSIQKGDKILEIGHGSAMHVVDCLKGHSGVHYTGLEISELMHEVSKKNNELLIMQGQADFVLFDGFEIPFKNETFNKIFTVNTLYFWNNPIGFLNELYRVIQHGGVTVVTFATKDFLQTLPFTAFEFTLYNLNDFEGLINQSKWKKWCVDMNTDTVLNKLGILVERTFLTVQLKK